MEARQMQAILSLPPGARGQAIARELFPTRAFMQILEPDLVPGGVPLLRAHARRYRRILRRLPMIVRAVRKARQ
jgi:hypothetical protein